MGCCTNPKPEDTSFLEQVPQKRDNCSRLISLTLCFFTASGVIAYGFYFNTTVEYKVDNDIKNEMKNITASCYRRNEKTTHYVLLNLGLGLLGMIFGNFVGRLCLVFAECRNWSRRYDKKTEMYKACFSGTSWYAVFACLILIVPIICVPLVKDSAFELEYMLYIFSGIGVGPLIMHLLNLNAKSDVDISTIIEEKETSVGSTLAWSYYVHYLKNVLPQFSEWFAESSTQTQDQSTSSTQVSRKLTGKLILIVPNDCYSIWNNNIEKSRVFRIDTFDFQVYYLTIDGNKFEFVAEYPRDPLKTIATMTAGNSKAIKDSNERKYQVKMFYKTLSEILEDPVNTECRKKYILFPIKVESLDSLRTEELSNLIIRTVEENEEQEHGPSVSDTLPNNNENNDPHTPIVSL